MTDISDRGTYHKGYEFGEIAYLLSVSRRLTKTGSDYNWYLRPEDGDTIYKAWKKLSEKRVELYKTSMY